MLNNVIVLSVCIMLALCLNEGLMVRNGLHRRLQSSERDTSNSNSWPRSSWDSDRKFHGTHRGSSQWSADKPVHGYHHHHSSTDSSNTGGCGTDSSATDDLLSSGTLDMTLQQLTETGPPFLPGIYIMNKAYNVYLGKPIYEQYGVDIIDYSFNSRYTSDTSGETYEIPVEFRSIPHIIPSCDIQETVNSVHYSSSTAVLKEQSNTVNAGVEGEVEVDGSSEGVPAETELTFGYQYGNSKTSKSGRAQASESYTYSFSMKAQSEFYRAEIDWRQFDRNSTMQFKPLFIDEIYKLEENSTNTSIMLFMMNYGTHVVRKMQAGSYCRQTISMSQTSSTSDRTEFHSNTKSNSAQYGWASADVGSTTEETTDSESGSTVDYQTSDVFCIGEVTTSAESCAGVTGTTNNPIAVSYELFKIWDILFVQNILSDTTINSIELFNDYVLDALQNCSDIHCQSAGVCSLREDIFTENFINQWDGLNFSQLWRASDNEYCFCDDGLFGSDCSACSCYMESGCCCNDNNECNPGLLCSPIDHKCVKKSGSRECAGKGEYESCITGLVYGVCSSGEDGTECTDDGCEDNSYIGLYCGYSALGPITNSNGLGDWYCDDKGDILDCGDSIFGNNLLIGLCGSTGGLDNKNCKGKMDACQGYYAINCGTIEGITIDATDCEWAWQEERAVFISCDDGYIATAFCGSGGNSKNCHVGSDDYSHGIKCCKFEY